MDEITFKRVARVVLLIWFLLIALVVLIPSWLLLSGANAAVATRETPRPPDRPSLKEVTWIDPKEPAATLGQRVETYKQQVLLYTQLVQAYDKETAAYSKYLDDRAKGACSTCPPKPSETYALIVKDTVSPMVNSFLAVLLGYIFVNAGTGLINNYLLYKKDEQLERIELV